MINTSLTILWLHHIRQVRFDFPKAVEVFGAVSVSSGPLEVWVVRPARAVHLIHRTTFPVASEAECDADTLDVRYNSRTYVLANDASSAACAAAAIAAWTSAAAGVLHMVSYAVSHTQPCSVQ